MNAKELFLILEDLDDPAFLDVFNVVTKDGRKVTGIQVDHDKKQIVMVQQNAWVEREKFRVDL